MIQDDFGKKRIVLVGLGLQGGAVGVAQFLSPFVSVCIISDLKSEEQLQPSIQALSNLPNIQYEFTEHKLDTFLSADCIIIGPSVQWNMPQLVRAREMGIPVVSEMELFFRYNTRPVIGVTGTRGKTTTTMLIYEMLIKDKRNVLLGGNIPGSSTLSLLEKKCDTVLLEMSSWQLSALHRIQKSPHIAVFTNMLPDHLNFYNSMDEYLYDKKAIYRYQNSTDHLIINESLQKMVESEKPSSKIHYFSHRTYEKQIALIGNHNRENVAAASVVGQILGVSENAFGALNSFTGVAFRMEKIASINGVDIYNDTTSTTPIAGIRALEALHEHYKHIVLIVGGNSKNLPINEWLKTVNRYANSIVCLKGTFTDYVLPALDKKKLLMEQPLDNLKTAFVLAITHAQANGAILFSPSATSFAMFKNEFDRGEQFNRIVHEYISICYN